VRQHRRARALRVLATVLAASYVDGRMLACRSTSADIETLVAVRNDLRGRATINLIASETRRSRGP